MLHFKYKLNMIDITYIEIQTLYNVFMKIIYSSLNISIYIINS